MKRFLIALSFFGLNIVALPSDAHHCPGEPDRPARPNHSCRTRTQTWQPGEAVDRHPGGAKGRRPGERSRGSVDSSVEACPDYAGMPPAGNSPNRSSSRVPYAVNQIDNSRAQPGRRASQPASRPGDFTVHDAAELLQTLPYYSGRTPTRTAQAIQNTGHLLDIARNQQENEGLWTRPACFDWPRLRGGALTLGEAFTDPARLRPGDIAVIPFPSLHLAYYEGRDRYGNDIFSQLDGTSSPVQIVTREYLERRAAAQRSRITYRKPGR